MDKQEKDNKSPFQYESGNGSTKKNTEVEQPRQTSNKHNYSKPQTATTIDSEVVGQVQSLLAQKYVDQRRFRTSSWQCGTVIQPQNKSEAIAVLESCLADHENEYVRLFGIQPNAKKNE